MFIYLEFDLFVYKMLCVMLAILLQVNFCYLLRFIIISSVLGAFSFPINMHPLNIGTQKLLLRKKVLILKFVEKLRKFQC